MRTLFTAHRPTPTLLIAMMTLVAAVGGGIAYAGNSSRSQIHGCVSRNGELSIAQAGKCQPGSRSIWWNRRGSAGPKGTAGGVGRNGVKGDQGNAGFPGAAGTTGATGSTGPNGATGAAGPKGATGAAGPKGATGAAGPKGDTGATGPKGDTGSAGPAGSDGAAGSPGVSAYEIVTATDSVSKNTEVKAACPAGKKAIGGGADVTANTDTFVSESVPYLGGVGWKAAANYTGTGTNVSITVYAVCATVA